MYAILSHCEKTVEKINKQKALNERGIELQGLLHPSDEGINEQKAAYINQKARFTNLIVTKCPT